MVVSFIGGEKAEYPEKATDLSYLITRGRDIQHLNDKHAHMECLSAEVESTSQATGERQFHAHLRYELCSLLKTLL